MSHSELSYHSVTCSLLLSGVIGLHPKSHRSSSQITAKDHISSTPGSLVTTDICPWGGGTVRQCWSIWISGQRNGVGVGMGDTQEVTDRRVKITSCSELLPRTSTQSPRVEPQSCQSWLFSLSRHSQYHSTRSTLVAISAHTDIHFLWGKNKHTSPDGS